jgi:pyruvate dehydrogenase E2 component (dihydrolipoamide acetyltransferase)/2-oxoglutarate dehydrogenase E2 component (dihydrolipoamide succinyltransferase)
VVTSIIAPKLGVSTDPVLVVEWKAAEGDRVEAGSVIVVIETEKVRNDIEAETSGFLHIAVLDGVEAEIGSTIGFIAESEEELKELQKEKPAAPGHAVQASAPSVPCATGTTTEPPRAGGERIFISPVARTLAAEHTIDISSIKGTGPGGRIVRADIEQAIESQKKVSEAETAGTVYSGKRVKSTIPLTGMRKSIAEHMHRSLSVAAQLTVMGEIEMTETVRLRQSLLAQEKTIGARISFTDLLVYTVSRVLRDFPIVNSSLIDSEIKVWDDINIAVAVATDDGLIVPVIKNADRKTVTEIDQEVKSLAQKARERRLSAEEVRDGTFTVTNLGALDGGYRFETVIINQPESAILGTGGITDRPVVRDNQVVIRPIMTYYFTYDHRAFDGAVAAQFIERLALFLENPGLLFA